MLSLGFSHEMVTQSVLQLCTFAWSGNPGFADSYTKYLFLDADGGSVCSEAIRTSPDIGTILLAFGSDVNTCNMINLLKVSNCIDTFHLLI